MSTINIYNYVFPIAGGDAGDKQKNEYLIKQIFGSSFSIGGKYFLTCAHVVKESLPEEWHGVGFVEGDYWKVAMLLDYELMDSHDICLVKADVPDVSAFRWSIDTHPMLFGVRTSGYPYALSIPEGALSIRSFTGNIVSNPKFYKLKSTPRVYELPFQCPRGLSGGPLLTNNKNEVTGIIIGNAKSEMMVFSDKEIINEGKTETIVERYESLQFGIALSASEIMDLHSNMLGMTVGEHLKKFGLL